MAVNISQEIAHQPRPEPQEEFIVDPRARPEGPEIIDTGECRCALQQYPNSEDIDYAWRCLGNRHADVTDGNTTGKWFPIKGGKQPDPEQRLPYYDATYPPDNTTALVANPPTNDTLVALDTVTPFPLNKFDAACTGTNNTWVSAHYYDGLRQTQNGTLPQSALSCFSGSIPLPIQNLSTWEQNGCFDGFFCPNNTINALPQYCTPLEICYRARISQKNCGVAMGVFEPIICPAQYYCPKGTLKPILCPDGSYCPEGSVEPLKCSAGSICSKGAKRDQTWLPFGFLLIIDTVIILAIAISWVSQRRRKKQQHIGGTAKPSMISKAIKALPQRRGTAGYKNLDDDSIPMVEQQPTAPEKAAQLRRRPTGFLGPMMDFDIHAADYSTRQEAGEVSEDNVELREFVGSLSRCIEGSQFGLSFEYEDLGFWPKGGVKPILSSITGNIARGSLVGVLGGSGAGKSTFVNTLMGKQKQTSGNITINGVRGKVSKYKKIIGYVPQDDIVLPELTVRENILHSARIRLPSHWSEHDIQHHVDALINCLQLAHVTNSLVGSTAKPVISGGQRKRVSIGMELAAAPMALFLDEPTSGLDATAASHIMKILSALSNLGITVVTIIHQPREEIFHAIDDLILLANGRLIYQGREQDVQGYFERAGFVFPEHANPADTLMDIITGEGRLYKKAGDTSKDSLIEHWSNIASSRRNTNDPKKPGHLVEDAASFQRSIASRGAHFHKQVYFCMMRSFLQQYRLKAAFWFEMGVATLAGFLIGLALNSNNGRLFHGHYRDHYVYLSPAIDFMTLPILSLLVAIGIGLVASAPGVKVFGEEKLQYRREAASGHNKLAYYLGKVISTGPRIALGCLHFTVLFMLLATPRINWLKAFLADLLYYYCTYGLASCVSMITRREDGPLLATIASLIVGILSGFAPQLKQVKKWHMLWLWRASPGTWIAESYFSENVLPLGYLYRIEDASLATGIPLGRYWACMAALLGIGTVYRIVAYVLLITVRRNKQK